MDTQEGLYLSTSSHSPIMANESTNLISLQESGTESVPPELEQKIRVVIDKYWGGKLYMKIPHPAFDNWPATYGYERWNMIKPHLDPQGGTALDIGAHFGTFSHLLEDFGFHVTAVEIARGHAEIMHSIRDMAGKQFKILSQSIFDIQEANYDLVFALNVFHHFLKESGSYQNLISFLNRLTCQTIIFQSHDPDEAQMSGSYRNYNQDEFCDFVREHSGLTHVKCIGSTGVRKIYKISGSK